MVMRFYTCSLQATVVIEALGVVGLRVYCISLTGFGLFLNLQVVPNIMSLFYLRTTIVKYLYATEKNRVIYDLMSLTAPW